MIFTLTRPKYDDFYADNVREGRMVITRPKNASPDMILTAFDVKFREKKDEIPPEVCRPLKTLNKNKVEKEDLQTVGKKQCRQRGSSKS